jgi:hypothetical protein
MQRIRFHGVRWREKMNDAKDRQRRKWTERLNFHRRWRRRDDMCLFLLVYAYLFVSSDPTLMRFIGKKCSCAHINRIIRKRIVRMCVLKWLDSSYLIVLLYDESPFFSSLFCLYLKTLCCMFIFTIELYTYAMGRIDRMSIHLNLSDQFELLPLCMSSFLYYTKTKMNIKLQDFRRSDERK